jgi:hypothetical protein
MSRSLPTNSAQQSQISRGRTTKWAQLRWTLMTIRAATKSDLPRGPARYGLLSLWLSVAEAALEMSSALTTR